MMGVASLVIAISDIVLTFGLFVIAGILELSTPGGVDEASAIAVILGLFVFACMGLYLVAIGLGIAGILQKAKIRVCAIIGAVLATSGFVITVSAIVAGMAMDA